MNEFETKILEHMKSVPKEYTQAIDGIRCELYLRSNYEPWFLRRRLDRMVSKGLIRSGRPMSSMFQSYNGTVTYGQATTKGDAQ